MKLAYDKKVLFEQAAIAAMQSTINLLQNHDEYHDLIVENFDDRGELKHTYPNEIAQFAVACADALMNELKHHENKENNECH